MTKQEPTPAMTEQELIQHAAKLARDDQHAEAAEVRLQLAEQLVKEPGRQPDAVIHYLGAADSFNQVGDYDSAGLCLDAARQWLPQAIRYDQHYLVDIFKKRSADREIGLFSQPASASSSPAPSSPDPASPNSSVPGKPSA